MNSQLDKLLKQSEKSNKHDFIEMKYMEAINHLSALWFFTSEKDSEGSKLDPVALAGSAFELGYHAGQMDMQEEKD